MILGPKQPAARAASSASSISFQEILSYFANFIDSTQNDFIVTRFLAHRLFEILSPSERVAFAGQIALIRFKTIDNISLVFRNPQDFVRCFFTLIFESYQFPVVKDKWGDFFKLVNKCPIEKSEKSEKSEVKKEKKERNSVSRQNEALQALASYFNNLHPHIITALLPVFHAYATTSKKGENSLFINQISFPFIESKTAPLVSKKLLNAREGIELGQKFRTLRQGKDCGVMFGLFRSLEDANQSYQARDLAPDTQATIRLFYEKFVSDKCHFPVIWQNIESLKQYVDSFSEDKKDAVSISKGALAKINEHWKHLFHELCHSTLSIDDIASLVTSTKKNIEAITGSAKKTTQDDSATTPRKRAGTEINPRTKLPISPSLSNIVDTSETLSLAQLAASAAYPISPLSSHAPSPSLTPSPSFQAGLSPALSEDEPFSLDRSDLNAQPNYVPRFSVRPSTPQRPPRSSTVSLAAGRVSLLLPPLSPPPERPGSTSPLSVNSSSPSPQGSSAATSGKSTPQVSPGHAPIEPAKGDASAALEEPFQRLQIKP